MSHATAVLTVLETLRSTLADAKNLPRRVQIQMALPLLDQLTQHKFPLIALAEELSRAQLELNPKALSQALVRWRRAHADQHQVMPRQPPAPPHPSAGSHPHPASAGIPPGVPVREYLRQLRNTPVDPDEEARRDREWRKTQAARNEAEEQAKKKDA
ncbi:hypothetical protein [Bordetella sp. FB-8]|uniref:hypothetical protein n=1 Tax=Bordetella sp. FB-8 TaxID=1159870 RepID=UPI0012DD4BDD|nr:hypothetical protein [Bordetella sp. FB-8]